MKKIKILSSIYFLIILSISCNQSNKINPLENINLIDFLVPDLCDTNVNCNLIYYHSERVEDFSYKAESIFNFKKDSVFVKYKVSNPRNSFYNQRFIIVKDRYFTVHHSVESPDVKEIVFNISKGDYLRSKQLPTREMHADINDISQLSITIESTKSRVFDTLYNNVPKRAIEVQGKLNYKGFQFLNKTTFKETIINGIGTTNFIEVNGNDTITNNVLDSLILVNYNDFTTL